MNPVSDIGRDRSERGESWTALWDALVAGTEWHDQAACRNLPVDWFWPDPGNRILTEDRKKALEACDRCPVRRECGDEGTRAVGGVWGGTVVSLKNDQCIECKGRRSPTSSTGMCKDCYNRNRERVNDLCSWCQKKLPARGRNARSSGMCAECYVAAGSPRANWGTRISVQGESQGVSALARVSRDR